MHKFSSLIINECHDWHNIQQSHKLDKKNRTDTDSLFCWLWIYNSAKIKEIKNVKLFQPVMTEPM